MAMMTMPAGSMDRVQRRHACRLCIARDLHTAARKSIQGRRGLRLCTARGGALVGRQCNGAARGASRTLCDVQYVDDHVAR